MTALLDHAGIEALIPHRGAMCLLDALLSWSVDRVQCRATGHGAPDHPLRTRSGLLSCHAIEYAAQAAALHGGLLAQQGGNVASPGFLASARGVSLHRLRLDDLPGPLDIDAHRLAGDERQLLYAFTLRHAGETIADGRLAVILNVMT